MMTDRDTHSPIDKATQNDQSHHSDRDAYGDELAMPQEDVPAGNGHMWSGKTLTTEDRTADDTEVGAPGHIPTHEAGPIPF